MQPTKMVIMTKWNKIYRKMTLVGSNMKSQFNVSRQWCHRALCNNTNICQIINIVGAASKW